MSQNIDIQSNNFEDKRLNNFLAQLRVPPSTMDTNEAWDKLLNGVKAQERKNKFQNIFTYWAAAAIVILILSTGVIQWFTSLKVREVPLGKVGYTLLPDSTMVTLNAGSRIEYKEHGWGWRRKVKFEGEALFDVKKGEVDFIVMAGNHTIRVLGSRFNVFFRNQILEVRCISGGVEVNADKGLKQILYAGEAIKYEPGTEFLREIKVNPERISAWTMGEFYFSQAPLNLVFDEIERQFNIKIRAKGFDPQKRIYTGYFSNNQLEDALYLVCTPMGLTYSIDKKNIIISFTQH